MCKNLMNMIGIININKPKNLTSASVVYKVRKILGIKQVGHMGTLDPQGTGVLIVGVGKATRLFDYFLTKDKEYLAEFEFGYTTTTLDPEGEVTATTLNIPSEAKIERALNSFVGNIQQLPPIYSAKSVGGVRAYTLARKGIEVSLKPSSVWVKQFSLVKKTSKNKYLFRIVCSSGTYIRSLARDLAHSLKSEACMTSIHRERSGSFTDKESISLEALEEQKKIMPIEKALFDIKKLELFEEAAKKILNGVRVAIQPFSGSRLVYVDNQLLGLGECDSSGRLFIKTNLGG